MNIDELRALDALPLMPLLEKAHDIYRRYWPEQRIQICTLLSIKTGGCSENCAYCAQSAHYHTGLQKESLLPKEKVLERAMMARALGSTRFCMGAAWKGIRLGHPLFPEVLEIIRAVASLGLEVCATLGKIGPEEALALKEAGLTAYNHNLDTSPERYPSIVTTHSYQDRLDTISAVQEAGLSLCCGGIIGLGEKRHDRLRLLEIISSFPTPPESVPINALIAMKGTPLEGRDFPDSLNIIRMVALARLALPTSRVRLSAGRERMSEEAQALCFYAGANSLFYGDKLLTAPNAPMERDLRMLQKWGLQPELPSSEQLQPLPEGSELYPEGDPRPCPTVAPPMAAS